MRRAGRNHILLSLPPVLTKHSGCFCAMGCSGSKVTVATYNLYWWCVSNEYHNCHQFGGGQGFQELYKTIADNAPFDLAGFQECDDVEQVLRGADLQAFDYFAPKGSDAPMVWSTERFQKIGGPGSEWIAKDKWGDRLMNWVRLREKATNTSIFFANTHGPLDQCGGDAGSKAASNYQGAIDKHKQPEDKVVFTGDFNCGSMDETMMTLGQGLFNAATDQSFNGADHVLVSPGVNLCGYSSTGGFPSDHQFLKMHLSLDNGTSNSVPEPALPVAAPVPLLTSASETHSADDSSVRVSGCPPPGANPCCTSCPSSHFCPSDQGCYALGQSGCDGGLCAPALSAETRTEPPRCDEESEVCEEIEEQRTERFAEESELLEVSRVWSEGSWTADWGPGGPTWPSLVPERRSRRRRRPLQRSFSAADTLGLDALTLQTVWRVVLPTVGALFGGIAIYEPLCRICLTLGTPVEGPSCRQLLAMDQSQFMQNFLTVNGLLFTILCGNTYNSLYNQQEVLFHALFTEVSEAKSLLEQVKGKPLHAVLLRTASAQLDRIQGGLCLDGSAPPGCHWAGQELKVEPADLLANRPMDDPLETLGTELVMKIHGKSLRG
ncbi:unnamed protein product [Symbiodinium sp. KB8]|nr:unnamed protein product [Symbiodinium sp. KB8]